MDKIKFSASLLNQLNRLYMRQVLSRPNYTRIALKSTSAALPLQNYSFNQNKASVPSIARAFSTRNPCPPPETPTMVQIAYYDEIKDLPNHKEKLLIDVREPHELAETGTIPTSINIPLRNLQKALSIVTTRSEFKSLYGRDKPTCNQAIIFTCKAGRRGRVGVEYAIELGYTKPVGQVGSALECSSSAFKEQFGRDKPNPSDALIFMCRIGVRSHTASEKALSLGYTNVKNYKGSWTEWAQKNGL